MVRIALRNWLHSMGSRTVGAVKRVVTISSLMKRLRRSKNQTVRNDTSQNTLSRISIFSKGRQYTPQSSEL